MYKALAVFVLLFSFSISFGQDLERARELVEHVRHMMTPDTIETVEFKTFRTNFNTGEIDYIEQFIDLEQQRVLTRVSDASKQLLSAFIFENDTLQTWMNIDGQMTTTKADEQSPTIIEMTINFRSQLQEFRVFIPKNYDLLSYDGMVDYGSIKGAQVTLAYYDYRKGNEYTTVKYVFSEHGDLIASVFLGTTSYVALHDIFKLDNYLRVKTSVFVIEDNVAYPLSELNEEYTFNKPVSETIFANRLF